MVNTGRPSRACELCRKRRVRCDETKPKCLKCQIAKRVCPGYRSPFDISIRDETDSTIRKARAANLKNSPSKKYVSTGESSANSSPERTSRCGSDSSAHFSAQATSVSPRGRIGSPYLKNRNGTKFGFRKKDLLDTLQLQISIEEQATCYFLSQFVLQGPCGGILNFPITLLAKPENKTSPLRLAFLATSLVALASRPNSKPLLARAHGYYNQALRAVSLALQDKRKSLSDSTLASVIMLSVYEELSCSDDLFIAWSNHLNGAKALVRLRDPSQLASTKEGLQMFEVVQSASVRQYMFGFITDPLLDDPAWAKFFSDTAYVLHVKTVSLRADANLLLGSRLRTSQKTSQVLNLLTHAKNILSELLPLAEAAPQSKQSEAVAGWTYDGPEELVENALLFPGRLYKFQTFWDASKYLHSNTSRVMVASIITRCAAWICAPGDHTKNMDYLEAVKIGKEAVSNVVGSVPYFLTWTGDETTTPLFPCGTAETPKGVAGLVCMAPMYEIGQSVFATTRQKQYIQGRLSAMGRAMGIKKAALLARVIGRQISRDSLSDKLSTEDRHMLHLYEKIKT